MKRLFNFLRIDIYFTVFIFLLSYLLVINSRIKTDLSLVEILRPDAPLAKFVSAFLILILIKLTIDYFQKKEVLDAYKASTYFKYFGISFILFLLISNLLGLFISTLFNTISRNFNSQTLVLTHLSRSIDFTLYGGLYLAYLFLMENNNYKAEIRKYDNALSSSVIQQLKSQLNPHFLFNNLNTLDELIEEDSAKASSFLHHFSELYRYSLVTSEKKLVPLKDEIEFVKNYFELMEQKYLGDYHLTIENHDPQLEVFVPPFCLQLLVENAIEHNLGRAENPVDIKIEITNNITVVNNKIPKKHKKETGGRALKNLSTQFTLLSGTDIIIESNDTEFKVKLPFINSNNDV